jgi:Nucleotidyltransferase domain.
VSNDSDVDADAVGAALEALSVPAEEIASALRLMPNRAIGVLVYGSRARNDFTPASDLDLLALFASPRGSRSDGNARLSYYTPEQLATAIGTLFGMHLARDGIILHDTGGVLASCLASMGAPDPEELSTRIRRYSAVLDTSNNDLQRYLGGLTRVARYLLRTAIYAQAIAAGRPCFSVRELAERLAQPELVALLSADPAVHGSPSSDTFLDLRARLASTVGPLVSNPYGSIAALIVSEWDSDRERATLATLATASDAATFDYSELPKVLL